MREFDLLARVFRGNPRLPASVTLPPGDDMGAVRIGGVDVLVAVDQVADGVHLDLRTTPLAKAARKVLTRNLSDVAAMAAKPVGAVVAAALPHTMGGAQGDELVRAFAALGGLFACPVFGGDVTIWDKPLLMSLTILAEPAGIAPVLRKGARVGDVVCVSGHLGGSLETVDGYTHHLDFEPRIALARVLAGDPNLRPHCMIDLSDGLARDLGHLCRAADLSAEIQADRLPVSKAAHIVAQRDHGAPWQYAVGDGEDYELCFTLSPAQAAQLPDQIDGVPITKVGVVTEKREALVSIRLPDGRVEPLAGRGWEHGSG